MNGSRATTLRQGLVVLYLYSAVGEKQDRDGEGPKEQSNHLRECAKNENTK